MSEFNGKQFYGYSMHNDRDLGKSTRNMEFQHFRPEFLERTHTNFQRNQESTSKNPMIQNYCRRRADTPEQHHDIGILRRDIDVETHMASGNKYTPQIRELSDQEIDNLITKIKTKKDETFSTSPRSKHYRNLSNVMENCHNPSTTIPIKSPANRKRDIQPNKQHDETFVLAKDLNKTYDLQHSVSTSINNNQLIQIEDYVEANSKPKAQVPQIIDNVRIEESRKPQAKWVEVVEPSKEARLESTVTPSTIQSHRNYNCYTPTMDSQMCMQHSLPAILMTEIISENDRFASDCFNVNPSVDNQTADTYIVEDSDLEFELLERENYTKCIKSKPTPDEMSNWSVDDGGSLAEFIAIESCLQDMDVTYLRNTSPLRFTEVTEHTSEDHSRMKIYINGREKSQEPFLHRQNEPPESPKALSTCDRCTTLPSKSMKQTKRTTKTLREQHLQRTFDRLAGGGGSTRSTTPCIRSMDTNRSARIRTNGSSPTQPRAENGSCTSRVGVTKHKKAGRGVMPSILRISKSIENLKAEKSNIFKKMSETQEKIIEVLDKLRINLLELNVPDNCYDKPKRQRNAFEFAVRFSRNFLYPIKGMLEDLKFTPAEQFNSLTSNEACNRVCYMYGLQLQSLNVYQKQVRYFHLDHVPQKLPILIDRIFTCTSVCLEKQIFSPQDVIVDCLLQKCSKFLDFLRDFQDGRLNTARENARKSTVDKVLPKYDLKMYMNDLNMYEPKLVPKLVGTARRKTKTKRHITSVAIEENKDTLKEMPKDDSIPTVIQNLSLNTKSSTHFNVGSGDIALPVLDKTVMKALQNVTKEQVRKVLQPILTSLGTALGNQNNPVDVEAIVNAFENKVFTTLEAERHLNDDNKCLQENKTVVSSSVDSLEGWTCKPLKAAKQTKTLRQQNNSRGALAKKHFATITTGNIAGAAAAAVAIDDDDSTNNNINNDSNNNNDGDDDNHTKSNANSLSQSNSRHSITHRRRVVGVADDSGGVGESNHKHNCRETTPPPTVNATAAIRRERIVESNINKSTKKLMNEVLRNEDQIDGQLPPNEDMEQHTRREHIRHIRAQNPNHRNQQRRQPPNSSLSSSSDCQSSTTSGNSTSDSDAGHNPKFKKHHSSSAIVVASTKHLPSSSRRQQQARRSSSHSQCQLHTQTVSRNATAVTATTTSPHRNSLHCLTSIKPKRNTALRLSQKRDPLQTPPLAPSVTPSSSSGHLSDNNIKETHQDHHHDDDDDTNDRRRQSHKDDMMKFLLQMPMDDLKIPLTSHIIDLLSMRTEKKTLVNQGDSVAGEQVDAELPDGESDGRGMTVRTASGTSYVELFKKNALPLYIKNSPYNTTENTSRSRLHPLPEKELKKLKPKPTPKPDKKTTQAANENNSNTMKENLSPRTQLPSDEKRNEKSTKPDLRFDDMIRERNQFLKLCEKNRYYNNPNFAEPWNVFSTISEMLLNEVLDTVEDDFAAGVSKFVEDFLELETKTQQ